MKKVLLAIFILVYVFFIYRTQMYTIDTQSMEPEIKKDSVVLVDKKYKYEKIKVGDIIAYDNGMSIIIHRVMEMNGDGSMITRGDNNTEIDGSHATRENYLGKYICNFTILGNIIIFFRGFYGFLVIVAIIVIGYVLKKPYRKLRRKIKNAMKENK